ncbi:MAG TPA: glycosyltransferase family 2 protein [Tepidisphaeraceae bacterium]|jgi:dolichol-phosphate mannosyltransferase|nr:glycosyltransferase family 2 protein [Tepidisphaeraceae bacterium]
MMRLSVVVPLLNEEGNLRELHARLTEVLGGLAEEHRLIFVDDGSTDGSVGVLREIAQGDGRVTVIRLSRNFGHEAASTAGLDFADGDAVVLMDADLQDPPEVIGEMVKKWREGFEIVYAHRRKREGETWFKRSTSWGFYRLLNLISDVSIPMDTGDFRLVDARVVGALRECRERDRFVRGLVAWTGFRAAAIEYDRPARKAGKTKYNPVKLLILSLDAAVGFSTKPLRLATAIGFLTMIFSLVETASIITQKLVWGIKIQGYALQTSGLFFLGGVQMLLLGILGEYLGRIYRQTQGRPLYVVAERIGEGK